MHTSFRFRTTQEDFAARITEAAYGVLLQQGLQRSFVDVELDLWQKIRQVFRTEVLPREGHRTRLSAQTVPTELSCAEIA